MKHGAGALVLVIALAACGSSGSKSSGTTAAGGSTASLSATLNGSGSTFQLPLEQSLIAQFQQDNSGVKINYPGGGSSKGKADLAAGLVDFAGSDSLLKPAEVSALKGKTALYFPIAAAPVTVSYHLSGGPSSLQLSPNTLADIFQGKIKKWNDSEIEADNSGATLPSTAITVAHRADGSGTTNNFTHFLTLAATSWTLGTGDTVNWPAGTQSGQGNAGVATIIDQTDGAIGYVDYADALAAKLTFAKIKNAAGEFEAPTLDGSSKAIAGATVKSDLTYAPQNAPGSGVYPITAPTWILVFAKQSDKAKGDALKAYLNFVLTKGQQIAPTVNYAPLSANLDQMAIAQLAKLEIG
jgi:phosphate transport system substrate-binding protein